MKIGILAAMDKELELLVGIMDDVTDETYDGLHLYKGHMGAHDIVAAKCGIGKVNSAMNTFRMIRSQYLDLIINSGVAGGAAGSEVPVGSLLVPDAVAYHDVWCGPGTVYGAADGMEQIMKPDDKLVVMAHDMFAHRPDVRFGLICSGDKFISTPEEIKEIKSHFPNVLAVDMESASIAQVCRMNGVPFNIVRVVSDTPGEGENIEQYRNFWHEAPRKTFESVRQLIERLDA